MKYYDKDTLSHNSKKTVLCGGVHMLSTPKAAQACSFQLACGWNVLLSSNFD
jgi:hypothetical protein